MRVMGLSFIPGSLTAASLVLRLGVGLVFVVHGWQKLSNGPSGFAGMLEGLSVPAPSLVAWLVTIAELGGGILLILGLLTRLVTIPLILTMIGAIVLVKAEAGIIAPEGAGAGAELDIALLAGLIAVLFLGPGALSVDRVAGIDADAAPRPVHA